MNILAEEQKKLYEKGVTPEELEKRNEEFLKLYYKLRDENDKKWWSNLTLEQRQKLHWLILGIYKLKNRIGGFDYELIKDESTPTDRPIIYVPTHVGKFDIEVISEAIKGHYYLLSGDYEHIQGIIDSPFISINGVFYFNEKVKNDRKAVSDKMIKHLLNGGNLMYFIEGTWNLTPNLPMLPCYWGIVDIAKRGNAIIVPVGAEQYGKHFKINIGKNFDMKLYGEGEKEKSRAIEELRDVLATLKWEIWETEPATRASIEEDEWEKYIVARFKEWPYFNKDYIKGLIYRPKGVSTPIDVFDDLAQSAIGYNMPDEYIYDSTLLDSDIQKARELSYITSLSCEQYASRLLAIKDARARVRAFNQHNF